MGEGEGEVGFGAEAAGAGAGDGKWGFGLLVRGELFPAIWLGKGFGDLFACWCS